MRPAGEWTDPAAVPGSEPPPASPAGAGGVERWLRQRRPLVLAVVAGIAAVVRVAVFVQLNGGPALSLHRWDASEMYFVDRWASTLAAGDWVTDRPFHPFNQWSREVVDRYLAVHAEVAERIAVEIPGAEHEARALYLWNRWNRGKTFHQEPLYAYLVAVTYRLLGADVRWVFAWQMAAGVGLTVLLYLAVRRQLGDTVAVVAALLAALAGPLVHQELVLLRESMVAFAGVALVYLTERARGARGVLAWLGLGAALGAAVLLKLVFLVYGAVVLAVLFATRRSAAPARAAALVTGLALALAPAVARNVEVGVPPLALTASNGIIFLESNTSDYRAGVGFVVTEHTPAIMAETEGRFWPAVSWALGTHPDRASILRMLGDKARVLWHWREVPTNGNFYFTRIHSSVLRVLPVTFFVLAPLGLVGLALGLGAIGRVWPCYALVASYVVDLLAFSPLAAPRVPLQAAITPFAALTLVAVGGLATGRVLRGVVAAVATAAVWTWTGSALPGVPLVNTVDYWASYRTFYRPAIEEAERTGDYGRAADVFRASLVFEPDEVRAAGAEHPAPPGTVADLVMFFASVHEAYANELEGAERHEAAQRELERARDMAAAVQAGTPPPEPAPDAPPGEAPVEIP